MQQNMSILIKTILNTVYTSVAVDDVIFRTTNYSDTRFKYCMSEHLTTSLLTTFV